MTRIALLVVLIQVAPAQESDAEKLFRKMEERITSAKTLQFSAKTADEKGRTGHWTFLLGEGNRLAIEIRSGSEPAERLVSDGTTLATRRREKTPPDVGAVLRLCVARMQVGTLAGPLKLKKEEVSKALAISDFKSAGREKIGDVEAEIVDYTATTPGGKGALRVWIDPTTFLPLKRTATFTNEDGDKAKTTTTYEGFKIDEKIDDAKFKLP